MESARPLRDVFADLTGGGSAAGDPDALLRDQGHPALPDDLVAEAVVSYADTAPAEVAEHLAPFVTAHSAVGAGAGAGAEPSAGWLDLLATAPAGAGVADEPAEADQRAEAEERAEADDLAAAAEGFDDGADLGPDPGLGLDFGLGAEPAPAYGIGAEGLDGAGAEGPGDGVDGTADDGLAEHLTDPGEPAGWTAAEQTAEPSTVDEPGPEGEPLG